MNENDFLFNREKLVDKIHASFSKANQQKISLELISDVLNSLDLSETNVQQFRQQKLMINRLIFSGNKQIEPEILKSFRYDQTFTQGVNLLVAKNNVGKSSVMKTVKFALTGDDSAYDSDVKSWIERIWLQFSLGQDSFTIYIFGDQKFRRAILVLDHEDRCLEDLPEIPKIFFDVQGNEAIQNRLQQFFFERLGIESLCYCRGETKVSTTWKTFFQAMLIPDSSEQYLLCDPQHAMGNQNGLILSTFLGFKLINPLNQLLISKKSNDQILSSQDYKQKEQLISQLNQELQQIKDQTNSIREIQNKRKSIFRLEEFTETILTKIDPRLREITNELQAIDEQISSISQEIKHLNNRERGLQEAIQFKLHFTGLEVLLCPNCDSDIDERSVIQEKQEHVCRLCNKPAKTASPDELQSFDVQAQEYKRDSQEKEKQRTSLYGKRQKLEQEHTSLLQDRSIQLERSQSSYKLAIETPEELENLEELYVKYGEIKNQISLIEKEININFKNDEVELRNIVTEKVRNFLRKNAEKLNEPILISLAEKIKELTRIIGVESITDITCSPMGKVTFRKNGQDVVFSRIKNPGEKFRIKLAFFIAMIWLRQDSGMGKHPGFLMIDQLGANEMIKEDCSALAKVLSELDNKLEDQIQVICFTARSEFEEFVAQSKIYRPQADKYVF